MGGSSEGGDDIRVYFEVNRLLNEYAEFWEKHWEKFVELYPHLRINIMAISDDEPFIDLEQVKDETTVWLLMRLQNTVVNIPSCS